MDRRTFMGGAGAVALTVPHVSTPSQGAALPLNPDDPNDRLYMLRKLAYAVDDSITFWWMRSTRLGLVDSAFTPLWAQIAGMYFWTRDLPEGSAFEAQALIFAFALDLETGKEISDIQNPYTGELIRIKTFGGADPIRSVFQAPFDKAPDAEPSPPGYMMSRGGTVQPVMIEGDDVWIRRDNIFRLEPDAGTANPLMQVNDWNTYHGSLKDINDPDIASAPATWTFNDINTWPGWMNMSGRSGNYVSRGAGRKVFDINDMPSDWLQLMARHHPGVLKDPKGRFDPAWQ